MYDNESNDGTGALIGKLANVLPVDLVHWPTISGRSPQRSAYNHSLNSLDGFEWVGFIDVDEFVVPWGYRSIRSFLQAAPDCVSSLAINWLGFGSSNLAHDKYRSVVRAFKCCSNENWPNNRHFKTIARTSRIDEVLIHDVKINAGIKAASNFRPLETLSEGKMRHPIYSGIQINHYQSKTYKEFQDRMKRGNANFPSGHPQHARDASQERFHSLDRNEFSCRKILKFAERAARLRRKIAAKI